MKPVMNLPISAFPTSQFYLFESKGEAGFLNSSVGICGITVLVSALLLRDHQSNHYVTQCFILGLIFLIILADYRCEQKNGRTDGKWIFQYGSLKCSSFKYLGKGVK